MKDQGDLPRLKRLTEIAKDSNLPLHHLAIAWVLREGAATGAIVGASKPEQVEEDCRVLDIKIPSDTIKSLDEAT